MIRLRPGRLNGSIFALSCAFSMLAASVLAADDEAPKPTFVDLQPSANHKLDEDMGMGFEGNNLKELPRGEQTLGETKFKIGEKMIRVRGGGADEDLPEKVEGIKVEALVDRMVFLHGTEFRIEDEDENKEIGAYVVHYADKTEIRLPIKYGRDLVDWWAYQFLTGPSKAKVAWEGTNAAASNFQEGLKIRLYAMTWTNPHPEKEVQSLDFVSKGTQCKPFLIAVTLDSPAPGKQ